MTAIQLIHAFDRTEEQSLQDECAAFDKILDAEIQALARIRELHEQWEEAIRSKAAQFDFQVDKAITARYRKWVLKGRIGLQQLELQEEKGCFPLSADAFRGFLEGAEEILLTRTEEEAAAISLLQDD